jgi:putative sugar O-methyltransferase
MSYEWNIDNGQIENYLKSCLEFSSSEEKFSNFKRDPRYKVILEHISKSDSDLYVSKMKGYHSLNEYQLQRFRENDKYGGSEIFNYDFFGDMSPSTIRYIKNSLDIFDYFRGKNIKNIVEIGGGYGGLCKTLSVLFDFDNYVIIDLPEVNKLSNKYLNKFKELKDKITQISFDEIECIENIDLVISNYAFSECSRNIQEKYYNNIILNTKYFYVTYNTICQNNINHSEFIDICRNKFSILVENDINSSHLNYVLYGTKK